MKPQRRIYLTLQSPAELAITDAVGKVEALSPDVRLTEAVKLLQQAKDLVGDYIDERLRDCELH